MEFRTGAAKAFEAPRGCGSIAVGEKWFLPNRSDEGEAQCMTA